MAVEVKPIYQSPISDDPELEALDYVTPSRYNTGSKITQATARMLGRLSEGDGDAEELTADQVKAFLSLVYAVLADVRSAAGGGKVLTADLLETASAIVTLTDAATIAIDWDTFLVAEVATAGNRIFGNPTNVQPGTTRYIFVKGSDATARTMSFASNYKGTLPEDTVTNTHWLMIGLTAYSTTHIVVTSCEALS